MTKELEALERIKKSPNSYREEEPRFTHIYSLDLDIVETALKSNKKKLDIIGEILVDISKGNYANLDEAIDDIREVLG